MLKYKKQIIAFSIIPQIAFIRIIAHFPDFVEKYYSNGLYLFISKLMRFSFGWLPFSVGDVFYTIATIYILRWLLLNRKRIIKDTKHWLLDLLSVFSIGYFAFHLLWAFNYYRLPLEKTLQIDSSYTTEELISLTNRLIIKANEAQFSITNNDTIKVEVPFTKKELLNMVPKGYSELSKQYPHLAYNQKSLKRSIYSLPLTIMGFSGYLNPFTNEAQIDGMIPKFNYPTTSSHEVAHQLGYGAENEASFIGSLAAMHHHNIYFKYSGYTFALSHCLNELYSRDQKHYEDIVKSINKGILKNYKEANNFWRKYQNPLEPIFKTSYNSFLKANNQTKGIESYNYVVGLLVNYFDNHNL